MKALTNTEVYRALASPLEPARFPWIALWRAQLKVACKRKLPLVLLLAPPVIATVIFSFVVYTRFALEAGETPSAIGGVEGGASGSLGAAMMAGMAKQMIEVREQIVAFHLGTNAFSLLLMAWFGAGLFAEDRRLGAHLLYFARPISKLDYALAKFLTVATFGALGSIAPALVICTIASFASPEWSFLKQEGDVIPRAIAFGALWTTVVASIVLAASTLAPRKTFALAGTFGALMLLSALATIVAKLERNQAFLALSPIPASARLGAWIFDLRRGGGRWDVGWAWTSVLVAIVVSWAIIAWRLRRQEAVA